MLNAIGVDLFLCFCVYADCRHQKKHCTPLGLTCFCVFVCVCRLQASKEALYTVGVDLFLCFCVCADCRHQKKHCTPLGLTCVSVCVQTSGIKRSAEH